MQIGPGLRSLDLADRMGFDGRYGSRRVVLSEPIQTESLVPESGIRP
jgi:hypothetical protein